MNPDAAEVRLEGHNANAMRWYAAGDADSVTKLFARDAWQMPPNAPPLIGREAIRSFWRDAVRWGRWEFDLTTQAVDVSGPLAVERGKYRLRFTANAEAPPGRRRSRTRATTWRTGGSRTTASGGSSATPR